MTNSIPNVKLNNDLQIPVVGLGTWQSLKTKEAVTNAIDIGYRHIDCAHVYKNEKGIGEALQKQLKENVKRTNLWITSKLWNTSHRADLVMPALKTTLANLGIDYLDLYLMHWPFAYNEGARLVPTDENGKTIYSDVKYTETWVAMEECVDKGLVRSIGLSNFNSEQISEILLIARIKPVVCQIECHPYLNQIELSNFCKERNIVVVSYMPLGSPSNPWSKSSNSGPLEDDRIRNIANKYKKTSAQILVRYQIDRGHVVIPKSESVVRQQENLNVFDFQLSSEDMNILNSMDNKMRICHFSWVSDHDYYPFKIPF